MFPTRREIVVALKERGASVLPVTFGRDKPEAMLALATQGFSLFKVEIVDDDPLPRPTDTLWTAPSLEELIDKLEQARWDRSPLA